MAAQNINSSKVVSGKAGLWARNAEAKSARHIPPTAAISILEIGTLLFPGSISAPVKEEMTFFWRCNWRPSVLESKFKVWARGVTSALSIRWMERRLMLVLSERSSWVRPLANLAALIWSAIYCFCCSIVHVICTPFANGGIPAFPNLILSA